MHRVDAPDVPLEDRLCMIEIGVIGVAATCAARFMGLDPVDALLAIFFTTTLSGQFLLSLLNRHAR